MNALELQDNIATVMLRESELILLAVMEQYWIESLPGDDPGTSS